MLILSEIDCDYFPYEEIDTDNNKKVINNKKRMNYNDTSFETSFFSKLSKKTYGFTYISEGKLAVIKSLRNNKCELNSNKDYNLKSKVYSKKMLKLKK